MRFLFFILTIATHPVPAQNTTSNNNKLLDVINKSTVVGLGEEGHGYESMNAAKADFIYLANKNSNFSAILFESSFTLSAIEYLNNDSLGARMKNFLYPFWNTNSVGNALKPFYQNEKKRNNPAILGFDLQEDCRFSLFSQYLLNKNIVNKQKKYLLQSDSILSLFIGKNPLRKDVVSSEELQKLLEGYDSIRTEFESYFKTPTKESLLLGRCFYNREALCNYLARKNDRMHFRDSLMMENVLWLKNEFFRDQKIILWTANTHVSKSNKKPEWMGEWLSKQFAGEYVAIAFFNGEGDSSEKIGNSFIDFGRRNKYDAVVYAGRKIKIKPSEWITPCFNY